MKIYHVQINFDWGYGERSESTLYIGASKKKALKTLQVYCSRNNETLQYEYKNGQVDLDINIWQNGKLIQRQSYNLSAQLIKTIDN